MKSSSTSVNSNNVVCVDFNEALSSRYLAYALSTIMARSLPDVRDGLKPVQRRLIYAMEQLRLNPNSVFKKSARIVGDVMGKFHPHGDSAIYGALVRLAQDFSLRYPLIEGQGNFGNIDGDNAAAMRYTEARLTPFAQALLEGLEENTVDFQPTYDGYTQEPVVMPAYFPNLILNGATGIAVGMATSIPPHNLYEVCHALIALIKNPAMTSAQIMEIVKGPDFPTGGLTNQDMKSLHEAYETGKGTIRLRSVYHREELKNGCYQIVLTEIPYMVEKGKIIEKIAQLILDKKITNLIDIIDESATDIRLVLVPKNKSVNDKALMEQLFHLSDLQTTFSINFNVLDHHRIPKVMSFKQLLQSYLDHRREVEVRRTKNRLEHIDTRLELLKGYLIVYLNLDEVIAIIRDDDEPKITLQQRFNLTPVQVEGILNMRLRSLRKLQEIEIRTEVTQLEAEQNTLEEFLNVEKLQWNCINKQIKNLIKLAPYDSELGKRRTVITHETHSIDWKELVEEKEIEAVTVYISTKNWVWTQKNINQQEQKYKEGDSPRFTLVATTADRLLMATASGRFYTLLVDKLPKGRQQEALSLLVDFIPHDEVIWATCIKDIDDELLLVTPQGKGFRIKVGQTLAQTKSGKQIFITKDEYSLQFCIPLTGSHVVLIGQNRKMLIIDKKQIPLLSKGQGVTLQKYKDGLMHDITTFDLDVGLSWPFKGKIVTLTELIPWIGQRGGAGRLAPIGFPRDNFFHKKEI